MKAGYTTDLGAAADAFNRKFEIQNYPGYLGAFSRQQAEGAIPNGTKVVKAIDEAGDKHHVGDTGVVLGSIPIPEGILETKLGPVAFLFWVEWDDDPGYAVAIISPKIKEAT